MNSKLIIIASIVILVISAVFLLFIKIMPPLDKDKEVACHVYVGGDPPLLMYPMNDTNPDFSKYKSSCENRAYCEWKLQDNSNYLCVSRN